MFRSVGSALLLFSLRHCLTSHSPLTFIPLDAAARGSSRHGPEIAALGVTVSLKTQDGRLGRHTRPGQDALDVHLSRRSLCGSSVPSPLAPPILATQTTKLVPFAFSAPQLVSNVLHVGSGGFVHTALITYLFWVTPETRTGRVSHRSSGFRTATGPRYGRQDHGLISRLTRGSDGRDRHSVLANVN
jgi:hypothetical protein